MSVTVVLVFALGACSSCEEETPRAEDIDLQLLESEGVVTREGYKIPTRYAHRGLASLIGSKRETMTKTFSLPQQAETVG